jgi:uncharacterized membrane protein
MTAFTRSVAATFVLLMSATSFDVAAAPAYRIADLGLDGKGQNSQAFGISPNGENAVGSKTIHASKLAVEPMGSQYDSVRPMWWSREGGAVGLPFLPRVPGYKFARVSAVNDAQIAVGTSSKTFQGSELPVPVMWANDHATQFPLPEGQTVGRANALNAAGVTVGSVGYREFWRAAIFDMAGSKVIRTQTDTGAYMQVAAAINDSGIIVGTGRRLDTPFSYSLVYDSTTRVMTDIGALPGHTSSFALGISNSGFIVGGSYLDINRRIPFIWSADAGMRAIPLPPNTTTGYATAVNSSGWVVGVALGGRLTVPFLYKDGQTYTLQSLLPADTSWDFKHEYYNSADSISENGTIVGTGGRGGLYRAFVMSPVQQ